MKMQFVIDEATIASLKGMKVTRLALTGRNKLSNTANKNTINMVWHKGMYSCNLTKNN